MQRVGSICHSFPESTQVLGRDGVDLVPPKTLDDIRLGRLRTGVTIILFIDLRK
jgi:hypothetical protein